MLFHKDIFIPKGYDKQSLSMVKDIDCLGYGIKKMWELYSCLSHIPRLSHAHEVERASIEPTLI